MKRFIGGGERKNRATGKRLFHFRKGMAAVFGCLCLCAGLVACGGGESVEETTKKSERAASVNNGTLDEDSVALAVGQTTVPYREYKAYYYFMRTRYEGMLTEEVWQRAGAGGMGKSIGQEAIEDVLRLIIQVKVIDKAAALQGVTLAADEREEADYNARKFCEGLSDEVRKENGITQSLLAQIFEENKLAEKMYNIICGKVDVNVTAEQSRAARVQMIYLKAGEGEKAAVKSRADQLCQKAKDAAGSFYKLAKDNTQAGEVETLVGQLDERTKLANTVLGMKRGEISNVVEEKDGCYIVYCVRSSSKAINEEYKNQVVQKRQITAFQDAYKGWSEQYEVKVSKSLLA